MTLRRSASFSVALALAVPLSPAMRSVRMPPTTIEHRSTHEGCSPATASAPLVGTVPHVGRLRWVTPTTLQIDDSASTLWNTEVHGLSLGPVTRQDHDPRGDPFDLTIPAVDAARAPVLLRNRATGNTSTIANVHVQDVAPDRPVMLIDAGLSAFVEVDLATLRHGRTFNGFNTASPVWAASYSLSGRTIVVQGRTSLTLFNTHNARLRGTITRPDLIDTWRLSPDEHFIVVAENGTITVIDAFTLKTIWSTQIEHHAISTAVDDNASASVSGGCRWTMFDPHGFRARSISIDGVVAPDGRHIARSNHDNTYVYRLS